MQVYIPPRLEKIFRFTVFKILENSFVKSPSPLSSPWYDLIIDLLPSRTIRPINVAKKLCPPSAMKSFFRRKYHYTEGATMPMLGKKFVRGYVFLYYLRGSGLKLINILELAKMRIV